MTDKGIEKLIAKLEATERGSEEEKHYASQILEEAAIRKCIATFNAMMEDQLIMMNLGDDDFEKTFREFMHDMDFDEMPCRVCGLDVQGSGEVYCYAGGTHYTYCDRLQPYDHNGSSAWNCNHDAEEAGDKDHKYCDICADQWGE